MRSAVNKIRSATASLADRFRAFERRDRWYISYRWSGLSGESTEALRSAVQSVKAEVTVTHHGDEVVTTIFLEPSTEAHALVIARELVDRVMDRFPDARWVGKTITIDSTPLVLEGITP